MAKPEENGRNDRRLLMLGATTRDAELLGKLLDEDGMTAEVFRDPGELCREVEAGAAVALLTERDLGRTSDLLADCLHTQPSWSDLPVLLAVPGGGPAARRAAEKLGNVQFIPRPTDSVMLANAVRNAFRARLRQYELRKHQEELRNLVRELSAPVLEVRPRVLLIPLIGRVDTERAQHLTHDLLHAVRDKRARAAVIDLTGVPTMDLQVANHLILTTSACRLLGADLILTGISSATAATLTEIGADLRALTTAGDLRSGLEQAEARLGAVSGEDSGDARSVASMRGMVSTIKKRPVAAEQRPKGPEPSPV